MSKFVWAVIISTFLSLVLGPMLIPALRRLKFGQNIREEGPKSHQVKAGTPTMGGVIFILTAAIALFIVDITPGKEAIMALFALIAFGGIGFIDDMLKIKKKKSEGLNPRQKMILLLIVSGLLGWYAYNNVGTDIYIPFANITISLGYLFIPFIIVYFVGVTNAVNLTDGLDGLATSITLLVMTFLALVSFAWKNYELTIFCGVMAGALLGFLRYNCFPASVFMGDTGSLALGGAVAAIAMFLKLELILVIIGGVYVAETLSVIIQVTYFKMTRKRIFKMAPLHHHFEESGWHESKVVAVFSIVTVLLCLFGFLSLSGGIF